MDELIARLEAATGPDEWCDYHLWRIALPEHHRWTMGGTGALDGVPLWGNPRKDRDWDRDPPRYTASIDAAITLVPEGWAVRLKQTTRYDQTCWTGDGQQPAWTVSLMPDDNKADNFMFYEHGGAATPALAICIAAIRARGDA